MRVFLLTLAAYLFVLTLFPCQDTTAVAASAGAGEVVIAQLCDRSDHPGTHHEDTCTPLCTCACCGAFLDRPADLLVLAVAPLPPSGSTKPSFDRSWSPIAHAYGEGEPPRG